MNCRQAQNYIQLDVDAELPAHLRESLEQHLDQCEACRRVRSQMRVMSGALSELAAPTHMTAALRFDRETNTIRRWRIPLAAAAAIAVLISGWGLSHRLDSRLTPTNSITVKPPEIKATPPEAVDTPRTQLVKATTPTPAPVVRVTFSEDSDVVALPVQTRNPNVTILRVYPKLQVTQLPESAAQQGS